MKTIAEDNRAKASSLSGFRQTTHLEAITILPAMTESFIVGCRARESFWVWGKKPGQNYDRRDPHAHHLGDTDDQVVTDVPPREGFVSPQKGQRRRDRIFSGNNPFGDAFFHQSPLVLSR